MFYVTDTDTQLLFIMMALEFKNSLRIIPSKLLEKRKKFMHLEKANFQLSEKLISPNFYTSAKLNVFYCTRIR